MFVKAANTLINMDKVEYVCTYCHVSEVEESSSIAFYRHNGCSDEDEDILDTISFDGIYTADNVFKELCEAIQRGDNLFVVGEYE